MNTAALVMPRLGPGRFDALAAPLRPVADQPVQRACPPSLRTVGADPGQDRRTVSVPSLTDARSQRLASLRHGLAPVGGLCAGDEVAGLLYGVVQAPISLLARWIVERQVVGLSWQGETLLPLFQFDLAAGCLRDGISEVIAELSGPFDDWEMTEWFAQPNAWLQNRAPAACLAGDPDSVRQAARADRFVTTG